MSEELTATAAAPEVPAAPEAAPAATPDTLANAAPVAPEAPAETTPAVADQATIDAASTQTEQPAEPAAAEQAPTEPPTPAPCDPISAETGLPAEPLKAKIETPVSAAPELPAAKEAPDLPAVDEPNETQIDMAKKWIVGNRKSSAAALQNASKLPMATVEKILTILEEQKVLGPAKEDGSPRDILIEAAKPKISVNPQPKKQFKKPARPQITDFERVQNWTKHLKEIGKLDDDNLIKQVTDYALKNQGFNPHAKWGSCLIVMINRFLNRLRDSLRTFTQSDADYLCRELLRFASEQPLGDGVAVWNSRYSTNQEQKDAVSDFFNINCSFRDLRGQQRICLTAIRDAAWPTKMEEKNGTGGTYAERFHYLALAIVTFGSGDYATELFRNTIHHEPTEAFLERINGGRPAEKAPAWIEDGHCKDCGSEIVKDSSGNDVCSNPICPNHFAKVASAVPKSFRSNGGGRNFRDRNEGFDPNSVPVAPSPDGGRRKKNWKKRRDDGDEGGDSLPKFQKKRPKGQRWRENHDDEFNGGSSGDGVESVTHVGEAFQNPTMASAFEGLTIPTADEPTAPSEPTTPPENLPEPPAEAPVV